MTGEGIGQALETGELRGACDRHEAATRPAGIAAR